MPASFGANDTPPCPRCKTCMNLTRRAPHLVYGIEFESQTFVCRLCRNEFVRSANHQGEITG
jgi:hypothetical protein